MSESYSESFKKQKVRYDARRASLVSNPWDFDERTNTRGHNPPEEHNYPYKGFYEIVPTIMKRDNYTLSNMRRKRKARHIL